MLWHSIYATRVTMHYGVIIPRAALANGLWLDEVPSALTGLTFVEKLAIARLGHNAFAVWVTMGQRMITNAVAFSQPIAKVYSVLLPPHAEFDDCLAILSKGLRHPLADMRRTPVILRHTVVLAALQWLHLNHVDYANVTISPSNLQQCPDAGLLVTVNHLTSDGMTGADSLRVNELGEEHGTECGECPIVMEGLCGVRYQYR